jgi:Panthothenate kinase
MKRVKGCPETYDLVILRAKIHELRKAGEIRWPIYSRAIHDVVEDAVLVNRQIIVLGGELVIEQ